jgi:hypothetical protein
MLALSESQREPLESNLLEVKFLNYDTNQSNNHVLRKKQG